MIKMPRMLRDRPPIRGLVLIAMAGVWCCLLLGIALPQWRQVQQQHAEIAKLEHRLADLDSWTIAGLWLEPLVSVREPEVGAIWSRLFPAERGREQLFLDLARAADRSGVRAFQLEEVHNVELVEAPAARDDLDAAADASQDADRTGAMAALPPVSPDWYFVKARFAGDYARGARFLREIGAIDRAIDVRSLVIRPTRADLDIELELKVYVNRPHGS